MGSVSNHSRPINFLRLGLKPSSGSSGMDNCLRPGMGHEDKVMKRTLHNSPLASTNAWTRMFNSRKARCLVRKGWWSWSSSKSCLDHGNSGNLQNRQNLRADWDMKFGYQMDRLVCSVWLKSQLISQAKLLHRGEGWGDGTACSELSWISEYHDFSNKMSTSQRLWGANGAVLA